ncbi:MAG: dihydroorotase [Planctomycetota bacterium]
MLPTEEKTVNYHIKDINFVDIFEEKVHKTDVFVIDGKIAKSKKGKKIHQVIEGESLYLLPTFIDLHAHSRGLKEKGKSTIEELEKSALRGGYSHLLIMPNTQPPIDTPEALKSLKEETKNCDINIFYTGCLTKGRNGKEYAPYFSLAKDGVIAFTDDGGCVQNTQLIYNIARIIKELNLLIIDHPELYELTSDTFINQSLISEIYGIDSSSGINENIIVYRDLCIAKNTNAKFHLTHISTIESIRLITDFKNYYKPNVSFDITPHHLLLSCEDMNIFDGSFNVKPFLKSKEEVETIQNAFIKNAIDIVVTDHAPHTPEEKKQPYWSAPYGFIGLEFAFPLLFTFFVKTGKMKLTQLVKKFTLNPARVLNINLQNIFYKQGNFSIWELGESYYLTSDKISSRAKNTPFLGYQIYGRVKYIFLNGKLKYKSEE